MIVGPHPLRGSLLHLGQTVPVVLAQPLMPNRSVEPLDIGILLRLAGLNVSQLDTGLLRPGGDGGTDVLRAIVAPDCRRFSPPLDDLLQRPDDPLRGQGEVDLDAQHFPAVVIDDVEGADAAAVCQLVVHEVHGPALVGLGRLLQRLWRLPDKAFAWLDAQVQLQLPVHPVDPFVVPF